MKPLKVVFVNIGHYDIYKTRFYSSYLNNDVGDGEKSSGCWGPLLGNGMESSIFDLISRVHRPPGLDRKLGEKIWRGDAGAIKAARSILARNFEYEPGLFVGEQGYDGMYIFDSNGKTITSMSIGMRGGVSGKIQMEIDESHPEKTAEEFSYSLCKTALPVIGSHGV